MKNAKLTDKTDNYRILSVYIDNIMRKTENHEQQTRLVFDCYTIVIVRSGKIHIEESGQQMILRKGDAIFIEKGKMAIGKNVVVIGGGNTAECSNIFIFRMGNDLMSAETSWRRNWTA